MQTSRIVVNNMLNHDDANKVLEAIEHVWGLGKVEVNLSRKEAILTYDERMASANDFEQAIKDNGFEVTL